ncbi:hypothetical protein HNR42_000720 [Deinobacterium chartae]|uniref:C4-type zinc ribbon domain-containing protein n=1 Tax=Deinobacterium chartae TaxID=521158 RepID=A0A841HWL0_9DEIO|nr:C4-type zinc ribbon domain-containing protein [Deinobacterium chartae]MBB6097306.1 hypothetical protein [Deinobacterium chartae]
MLERLYRVQQMDTELDRLKDDETRIPGDLAEARREHAEISEALESHRRDLEATRKEINQNELELADYQDKLTKARDDQQKNAYDAKVQTQYENLIQQLGDRVSDLEEALEPLYARREQLEKGIAALEERAAALAPRLSNLEAMDDTRIGALRDEYQTKKSERDALANELDKRLAKEYEMIRKARKGLGVAAIMNGRCAACNMHLPITVQQRAATGALPAVKCPSCGRLLVRV